MCIRDRDESICYGPHFAGGKQPALYVDAGKDRRSCALFPCGKPDMEIRRGKLPDVYKRQDIYL